VMYLCGVASAVLLFGNLGLAVFKRTDVTCCKTSCEHYEDRGIFLRSAPVNEFTHPGCYLRYRASEKEPVWSFVNRPQFERIHADWKKRVEGYKADPQYQFPHMKYTYTPVPGTHITWLEALKNVMQFPTEHYVSKQDMALPCQGYEIANERASVPAYALLVFFGLILGVNFLFYGITYGPYKKLRRLADMLEAFDAENERLGLRRFVDTHLPQSQLEWLVRTGRIVRPDMPPFPADGLISDAKEYRDARPTPAAESDRDIQFDHIRPETVARGAGNPEAANQV